MNTYFIRIQLMLSVLLEEFLIERKISFTDMQIDIVNGEVTKIYSSTMNGEDATALQLTFPILGIMKVNK